MTLWRSLKRWLFGADSAVGFRGDLGVKIKRASRPNPWQRAKDFLRSIWL